MTRYCNFRLTFILALVTLMPAQVLAQAGPGTALPGGMTLPGSSSAPASGQTCVQVEIAGQKPSAYNCLNQQLQQEVEGSSATSPSMPLSANSPSNAVGTFNRAGVAEQYGQNFGKSVIPYRPPPPVYSSSLSLVH